MKGQTIIGKVCAWCDLPAEGTVEVAPARKVKGEWEDGITVPACGEHMASVEVTQPIGMPLRRKARDAEQLSLIQPRGSRSAAGGG